MHYMNSVAQQRDDEKATRFIWFPRIVLLRVIKNVSSEIPTEPAEVARIFSGKQHNSRFVAKRHW